MTVRTSVKNVVVPSLITTLIAILTAVSASWLVIPPERMPAGAISTLIITPLIALPLSIFVWSQVQRNKALTKQLETLLATDHLTGLATRTFFFDQLKNAPDAAGTTLMIDIDHFKQVNDTHGHWFGDKAIKAVADVLRRNTRPEDIACRFGGEEFLVFLNGVDMHEGTAIAQRIREAVAAAEIDVADGTIKVTVSVGGAEKAAPIPIANVIKAADKQLYIAKESGRNRVCLDHTDRSAA